MQNVEIKKAKEVDIKEIVKIHKDCVQKVNAKFYNQKTIQEWIEPINFKNVEQQFRNSDWFIIKQDSKILGFAQISLDEGSLDQINIDPEYQGKGLGALLYKFLEKEFKKNKVKKITLDSTLNAREFYKQIGFKEIGQIKFKLKTKEIKMIEMEKEIF